MLLPQPLQITLVLARRDPQPILDGPPFGEVDLRFVAHGLACLDNGGRPLSALLEEGLPCFQAVGCLEVSGEVVWCPGIGLRFGGYGFAAGAGGGGEEVAVVEVEFVLYTSPTSDLLVQV